jgi:hypothetical protein
MKGLPTGNLDLNTDGFFLCLILRKTMLLYNNQPEAIAQKQVQQLPSSVQPLAIPGCVY